ncbi:serine hydrolase domain-containing protein [Nocardioides euryhalodurans]|uniref:Class C beta-lactamase-related serine hydrolase n=1 Tax=Nocardioides euryhalodurans TaxID=2518370 RepID=A0A4P7GKX1_9ACTN|nr:serine hydrolase [Nocardioides euryhalodurans]QBR92715.1 class C beta-lactamase-related serine hydrolase [Nocardioides euryhalodurans]
MRIVRRLLLGLFLFLLVALVAGYWWQRPLLLTGTGYAAHNACALETIAGRDDPEDDLPPNPLVPVLRTATTDDGAVQGSILGLLARQRAFATDGFGCTLADEAPELPDPLAVTTTNPYADVPEPTPAPDTEAAVARAFGDDLDAGAREELGTRAVLVMQDGELVAERYAEGFDATTPQLGWSMSKSVTSLVVGRLVAEGEVSLDDDDLRPEWRGDERSTITVRDLLSMTSGLAWDETYDLGTPITRMLYLEPDMGDYVASQELAHQPGTHLQYSSGSTTLLCDILGERTGLGANLPRETVFAPLGMSSAVLEPDASGTPVCSSYLWATPRDWAAIGQLALQDGEWEGEELLPEGWMAETTTAVDAGGEREGYAAGWWANELPDGTLVEPTLPADAYFAEGHDGQWIVVVPSEDLVVVRLGFTPVAEDDRVVQLAADLIGG